MAESGNSRGLGRAARAINRSGGFPMRGRVRNGFVRR